MAPGLVSEILGLVSPDDLELCPRLLGAVSEKEIIGLLCRLVVRKLLEKILQLKFFWSQGGLHAVEVQP